MVQPQKSPRYQAIGMPATEMDTTDGTAKFHKLSLPAGSGLDLRISWSGPGLIKKR